MTTPLSEAQLERLRRDAKRIACDKSIPLNESQHQLALERGFKNWSLMVRATNAAAAPTQPQRNPAPAALALRPSGLERFYLHGDASEDGPGRYFCVRCDDMHPVEHFQRGGEHGDQAINFERFLYSHGRWLKRREVNWPDKVRPDDALNLFAADACAARAKYEASRSEFHKWLETQRNRDTPVGDLASDILRDKKFPVGAATKDELVDYLDRHGSHVLEALNQAWKAFQASQRRQQGRKPSPQAE